MDDAQNEKLARDAAEGRMRMKRRNQGLDLDDDISDDENDPDAKRRRERMRKKQRREDATLDELGESLPFACGFFYSSVLQRNTRRPKRL